MHPTEIPIYGNYHGYYHKRPSASDSRLACLPPNLFHDARVLDVGCNEGFVTCEIAQTLGATRVVGVDIDDTLVRAAWKHRRTVWSQQGPPAQPPHRDACDEGRDPASGPRKRRRTSDSGCMPAYFPEAFEHMFGPLPVPDAVQRRTDDDTEGSANARFPHNVSFRAADWVAGPIPEDEAEYDVVVAFSVSKWIHLNGGDDGLLAFFRRVHSVLRVGGTFVFEPQEWDTYAKAKRMDVRLKENAAALKLRPGDFERELQDLGFGPAEHMGTVGDGGFRRPIDLYVKVR
ncbi:Bin3-domain-containing protein [Epithele typhae]|uniref:Bin3-domain-containing protein n=1 Tax=Epithele typhae TaxID=378194 RepID=UPI0020075B3A|nr:Bin3-domain-containing protein [Epithele typhae]KAH9927186.1 Bin3-domain-containing protein [Epithele typhae]